jgi:hypothetical protein
VATNNLFRSSDDLRRLFLLYLGMVATKLDKRKGCYSLPLSREAAHYTVEIKYCIAAGVNVP